MTVVKINAITVREGSGDELARRFAHRAGAVDDADGFEGFELLQPADERDTWLVVTRWRDDDAFNAWVASPAFGHGHRGSAEPSGQAPHGHGASGVGSAEGEAPAPLAAHSELWAYQIVDLAKPG
jgi:heme-degrading monooxygenase HmoA